MSRPGTRGRLTLVADIDPHAPRWDPPDDRAHPTGWQPPLHPHAWPAPQSWPAPAASQTPVWYLPQPYPPLTGPDRGWVPAAHWVALLTTWLGPFVILLTVGERSARVREHAQESLNFEITFWLLMLVAALGTFVLIGYVFLVLLPILWLVLRVMAALDAAAGKRVRYPLTLRLVR